ncbi:hypothetical protein ACTHQ6_09830 [Arthrobacter sp. SAFR-179]|uniref:hypothetical protein n=1 Tax=Arthrobacter sp. SAFR-179 TaxID=3387279 RepID=UPI003F7B8A3E
MLEADSGNTAGTAEHVLSEEFLNLTAAFALGAGTGPDRWVQRHLLSDYDFTPWETFDPIAVGDDAPLLAASPHWLRTGDHTHLIGSPLGRSGTGVPHPAPLPPELVRGLPVGQRRPRQTPATPAHRILTAERYASRSRTSFCAGAYCSDDRELRWRRAREQ